MKLREGVPRTFPAPYDVPVCSLEALSAFCTVSTSLSGNPTRWLRIAAAELLNTTQIHSPFVSCHEIYAETWEL
jgi:hypothetical protein